MRLGEIQFSDGTLLTDVLDGYSGGGGSGRYTPIDGYTVINWRLNDTASPFINSGTAGTLNLTKGASNEPTPGIIGTIDSCVYCNNTSATYLTTAATSTGEVAGSDITISFWVKLMAHVVWGGMLQKCLYVASNTTDNTFLFQQTNVAGGWGLSLRTTTLQYGWSFSTVPALLTFGQWHFLAQTYGSDGYMKYYKDGKNLLTRTASGTIDWGTHGAWRIMQRADGVVNTGYIEDIRIESVARSEEYILNMYKRGVGLL